MSNVHHGDNPVKSNWRLLPSGMNLPRIEDCERILHDDEQTGFYCWGDVSIWKPEDWPQACDNWHWAISPDDDQRDEEEMEILEAEERERTDILDWEHGSEEEYLLWLDSLAPCDEELTAMERHFEINSWDFGHDA